jgi:signal recognition particle subunit SRP54
MLSSLGNALKKTFDKLAGSIFLDKKTIDAVVKELQRALIEADVNVALVAELSKKIREAASEESIKGKGIDRKEHLVKLLHDELLAMLGGEKKELELKKQTKIMMLGLYGAGKTTHTGKLALYYSKRGRNPCMVGLDVHRPAATDQLEQIGKQIKMPVFVDKKEKDPVKIYKSFEKEINKHDVIIIDTAGRHSLDKELVDEIKLLKEEINPDYVLLVIQADIGQAAKKQASEFQQACAINGVIVTRMDSSAKGGGALTACKETKAPVFFIGTGEKMPDIETFSPSAFISRILGLGDLESLVEKVKTATSFDEKKQKKLQKKLAEGKLDLRDLQEQLKSMKSIGSLSKIAEMIPGLGKAKLPDNLLGTQEEKLKKWQHAIDSMTPEEIENPDILEKETSRLKRIAIGSGTTTTDIRQLLKQYKMLKELTQGGDLGEVDPSQGFSQKQMMKLAKKFGKRMRI